VLSNPEIRTKQVITSSPTKHSRIQNSQPRRNEFNKTMEIEFESDDEVIIDESDVRAEYEN
jgi:hypothetical protein